jgi:hypothetical protein
MFENVINSKKQGDVGMCYAIAYYSRLGWTVSIPITDSQDYDLLVENTDNNILKVQVKTSRYLTEGGTYQVSLKTCGGNKSGQTIKKMDKNYIDLVFVLVDDGSCYSIPTEKIESSGSMNLGDKYSEFKVFLF